MVVDKLVVNEKDEKRLRESVKKAIAKVMVMMIMERNPVGALFFAATDCPTTGLAYSDPAPYNFPFIRQKGLPNL